VLRIEDDAIGAPAVRRAPPPAWRDRGQGQGHPVCARARQIPIALQSRLKGFYVVQCVRLVAIKN